MKFLSDILARAGLVVDGTVTLNSVANATTDTDRFIVVDSGVVKYRTGTQLLSDIGGISGNQTITLSGDATGSGTTSIAVTLANSGVTAGTYGSSTAVPVITVDAKGRVISVTTASISGSLTFTGDVTGTGTTGSSTTLTLANSGVTAGTYNNVTVNAKGLVTSGLNVSYLTSYTETDTLATVTGRGNTTTTRIGVTTSSPINFATSGNIGTWIGGIQDATTGWSISNNGLGLKADDNTYAGIVLATSNGLLYFGRTQGGVGTMASWLTVSNTLAAIFASSVTATSFIRSGGTSSQFLKADGSVDSTTYQSTSQKGQANGYASLDGAGKVPIAQLPSSIMEYKGTWNASTNSPSLADGTGDTGDVYRVSTAGTRNLGSGSITFDVGDYVIYNGTIWEKSDTTDAVASVNGFTGVITLTTTNIAEGTNLYYTDARARAALSFAAGSGAYNSSTGVITIPTNTNQLTNGAGFITSSALSPYLLLAGGNMTGNIAFGSSGAGLTWAANTDGASITFESTGDGASGGRALSNLLIALTDNGDEGLKVTTTGSELLYVNINQFQYKGNNVWHAGNLTNLNQLTNGPGYITSYTETDTLATVTNRGNTTTGRINVRGVGNQSGGNILMGNTGNASNKWSYLTGAHYNADSQPQGFALIGGLSTDTINAVVIGGNIYEANPATEIQFWTHSATTHNLGGTQRGVINSSGNWGVGTLSPGYRLHVRNSNTLEGTIAIGHETFPGLIYSDAGSGEFRIDNRSSSAAGYITFYPNGQAGSIGNEAMRITTTRNVGIGTTSPSQRLEVNGNIRLTAGGFIYGDGANADLHLSNNGGSILRYGGVSVRVLAASVKITATSEEISLQNNNGTIWMNAAGNVGIANSSPTYTLQVGQNTGGNNVDYGILIARHGNGATPGTYTATAALQISEMSNAGPASVDTTGIFNMGFGRFSEAMTNAANATLMHISYDGNLGPLRIDGRGNMWIGYDRAAVPTNSGTFGLLVRNGLAVGSSYQATTPPTSGAIIQGNVGIGTTSPITRLHVEGAGQGIVVNGGGNASYGSAIKFRNDGYDHITIGMKGSSFVISGTGSDGNTLWSSASIVDRFAVGGTGQIRFHSYTSSSAFTGTAVATLAVDSSGNVITVSGSGGSQWTTSGSNIFYNTGNVGIGTNSPSAKLHVFDSATAATILVRGIDANLASSYMLQHGGGGARTEFDGTWYMSYGSAETNFGLTPNLGGGLVFWFNSGATTVNPMTLKRSGNVVFSSSVGIGTSSPAQRLDVRGYIVSDSQSNGSESAFYLGNSSHGLSRANLQNDIVLYTTAGDVRLSASTASTTHLIVKNSGNVGINNTNPGARLHVESSTLQFRLSGNSNDFYVYAWGGGVNVYSTEHMYFGRDAGTDNKFYFQSRTASSTSLFVNTATERVGIFTTTPQERLDVRGNILLKGDATDGGVLSITRRYSIGPQTINFNNNHPTTNGDWTGARITSADAGNYNGYLDLAVSLGSNANEAAGTSAVASVMRLTHNRRVGVGGNTSPDTVLTVQGTGSASGHTTTDMNNIVHLTRNSHSYILFSSPDNFDQGLHFANTTDNGIVGRIAYFHRPGGDSLNFSVNQAVRMTLDASGGLTITGTLTEQSAARYKENIAPVTAALDKVDQLKPVSYNKKGSATKEIGLIAEDVFDVYPEFVLCDDNGEPVGVHYSRLTAVLIESVKELKKEINELKNRN